MKKSIIQKIIEPHLIKGKFIPGEEIGLKIDQTLTQDATGTMVYLQFESLNLDSVKTELSVSYVDHNTVQEGYENADDHIYLQSAAAKFNVFFSRAGNGICHQVHLERFSVPGKTLLGSDSHTPTCGGTGMVAIGAGGIDVALAMAGMPFYLTCPRIVKINLSGKLPAWSSAKDIILTILKILTTKGNTGTAIEYGGDGVSGLSVPERATIANMGAELGVTTSVFPSDTTTLEFLKAQGRAGAWTEIYADDKTAYNRVIDIDMSAIQPMAAQPHSPDNVCPVREAEGKKVDQVTIGSCTNSSFKDMMTVAAMLKGKTVHPDVSLVIAPGSRQVFTMLAENGALASFVAAGARILEPVCGFCIGNCHAPKTGGVSLRTTNRNFKGRSGTESAEVYLVSPETATASALAGKITDPRDNGVPHPEIKMPKKFSTDDSMIIKPPATSAERKSVEIFRGPNIGKPLHTESLSDSIRGRVEIKLGDKITTDDIMPAGVRLKYRSNIQKYSEFVFERKDRGFSGRCVRNKEKGMDSVIVAGESYGQGSSREHAAVCPRYLGVKLVLAKSFERIHRDNLINYGIVPLTFADAGQYSAIEQGDEINAADLLSRIKEGKQFTIRNVSKNLDITVRLNVTERQKEILLNGGVLNYAKKQSAGG